MATHVSVRLYWHDHGWDGAICRAPKANTWCEANPHIRAYKDANAEAAEAGKQLGQAKAHPPCEASAQAFAKRSNRIVIHPPAWMRSAGVKPVDWDFQATSGIVWPYEDFWHEGGTHKSNAERRALAEAFLKQIVKGESLAFFYVDENNPLFIDDGERSPARVLVGVSRITQLGQIEEWAEEAYGERNMVWAVPFKHAYPKDGIRLPVHGILETLPEAERRRPYLVPLEGGIRTDFRYGSSALSVDRALAALEGAAAALASLERDGVLKLDLSADLAWLNSRILELWKERGPYPGFGAVLAAMGVSRAAELQRGLIDSLTVSGIDPMAALADALEGRVCKELAPVMKELAPAADEWTYFSVPERQLVTMVARMELEPEQARRVLSSSERATHGLPADAAALVANPYLLAERYLPPKGEEPIAFLSVDHAMHPHDSMSVSDPISNRDPRRARALMTAILKADADDGHTFAPTHDVLVRMIQASPPERPCDIPEERLEHALVSPVLDETIERFGIEGLPYLALRELHAKEVVIEGVFRELVSRKAEPAVPIDWQAIAEGLSKTQGSARVTLTEEQKSALNRSYQSGLSVITGAAGTGKSTLLAPLVTAIRQLEGQVAVRALAPTGKAADRLNSLQVDAMTIHRALASAGWYDWKLGTFREGSRIAASSLIVDEASMVSVELLGVLFNAVDWNTVRRLILVGDHHQLPPIGPGRPFYDLIAMMRSADLAANADPMADRLSELTQNYRVRLNDSRAIALASGFAGSPEPDDPLIWSAIAKGEDQRDLRVRFWNDAETLHGQILEEIRRLLVEAGAGVGLSEDERARFNATIGHDPRFEAAFWQVIVPVRGADSGSRKINAVVQDAFHAGLKHSSYKRYGVKFGGEEITLLDKVIQISNEQMEGYRLQTGQREKLGVFNGQLGTVRSAFPTPERRQRAAGEKGPVKSINVEFDGMPAIRFRYTETGRTAVDRLLELAYAITVHKSQGSQFDHVFFILPRVARSFLGRELVYTGLTRARERLTVFLEKDISALLALRKQAAAQTPRRRSRLFGDHAPGVSAYRADRLIHVTARGELVRSKSEVIIANRLADRSLTYEYEKELFAPGGDERDMRLPDFTISYRGKTFYWEHCGMMADPVYAQRWSEVRMPWYKRHGFDSRLIVTADGVDGSIDTRVIDTKIAELMG